MATSAALARRRELIDLGGQDEVVLVQAFDLTGEPDEVVGVLRNVVP